MNSNNDNNRIIMQIVFDTYFILLARSFIVNYLLLSVHQLLYQKKKWKTKKNSRKKIVYKDANIEHDCE